MKIIKVSVIGEWVRNLNHLNSRALKHPAKRPTPSDSRARITKWPRITNGVPAENSNLDRGAMFWTVPKRMIETMSLNTPSPYTIEKSFG